MMGLTNVWAAGDPLNIQLPWLISEPTATGDWAGVSTLYLSLSWDRQAAVLLG